MIGEQPTGRIEGVHIVATAHEGLRVTVNGKPARLAVITEDGQVVAAGATVAREAEAVTINCYRNLLKGQGHLQVWSAPIEPAP